VRDNDNKISVLSKQTELYFSEISAGNYVKVSRIVSGFSQTQQYILFSILTICFSHLTIFRPCLQNLKSGACSENSIHVIWDPIRLTNVLKYIKNSIK
jgi:hypothetical protein